MTKSPEMKAFLSAVFPDFTSRIDAGRCPLCTQEVNTSDFRDNLSLTEFRISGMCQGCQDAFFTEADDDDE